MKTLPGTSHQFAHRVASALPIRAGRRWSYVLLGLLTSSCAPAVPWQAAPLVDIAITNVSVVDVERGVVTPSQTVLIVGNHISGITGAAPGRGAAGRIVDGTGQYLIPGLWDAHVHLSFLGDSVLPQFVGYGVTSVRDVGARFADILRMRQRIAEGSLLGPRIKAAGPILEGQAWMNAAYQVAPPDDPLWAPSPRVVVSGSNAQHVVDSLKAVGVDLIKSRNVWGDDFVALARATERAGLLLASHNPNRVHMVTAAREGLDSFEHAESIWGDFDTLSVAAREAMFRDVAATGAMVTPTLMADIGLVVSSDSVLLAAVADSLGLRDPRNRVLPPFMRSLWQGAVLQRQKYGAHPAGTFARITRDVRAMHKAGIPMLAGTDPGGVPLVYPGSSLHEELVLLVEEGGMTPLEALQSATINPARFFRMQDLGTIRPGQVADLVLLRGNPLVDIRNSSAIEAVVIQGRLLDRRAIDGLVPGGLPPVPPRRR